MQRVERTARIPAPPDEVFAYLSDLENLAEWQGGITSARRTSSGPIGAGSTAEVTREMMGQRILAPLTVTDFQPPTRMVIDSEVSGVRAHATLDLVPAGADATDVTFAMEIRGSMLTTFMEPMIASAAGGDIDASLRRLEARFASGKAGSPG